MQTATANSSISYDAGQATASNSTINTGVNNTNNQTLNDINAFSIETETMDLSSETEPQESKGILESIGDGLANAGAAVANGFKSAANWAIDGLKGAGATLVESASNFASDVQNIASKAKEWLKDTAATVGSTAAVIGTSVVSGIAKLKEIADDGIEWVGGKVVEGGAWLAGQVVGLFSEDAKNSIDSWRQEFSKSVKEDIARDKVAEVNKMFYEGTDIGKWINAHSAIKYDSEVAKTIQGVTTTVAEIAAATALTICTGGAAAPFVVGAFVGAGRAAESTYQNYGTDTTVLQELGIAGSGALTGLTWAANGKLGQGALQIGADVIEKGGMTVIKDMGAQVFNKEFVFSKLKEGLLVRNGGKFNLNALLNYGQAAMGTAGSLTPYITGEEEFNATAALKIGGTFLGYLGMNVLEDSARDYVSAYKSTGAVTKILTEAERAELAAIPAPVHASTTRASVPDPLESGFRIPTDDDLSTLPLVSKGKIDTGSIGYTPTGYTPTPIPNAPYQAGANAPLATIDEIQRRMDQIGITSPAEQSAYRQQLIQLSSRLGITPDETQKLLDEKLLELVEDSEFGRRTGVSTLERCLDSGDIKNQFQTNISSGLNDPNVRAGLEADAMHVPYDSAYADRPIYGMLFPSDSKRQASYIKTGPGQGYGQGFNRCVIMFNKDAVIDSTSLSVGDSLDYSPIYNDGWASPTKASDPTFTGGFFGFADKIQTVEDLKSATLEQLTGSYDDYIEVQIHGADNHKMIPEVIKEVVFDRKPSSTIIKKLENAGIDWRVAKRRLLPW